MKVPFVDLKQQYATLKVEIGSAILDFVATTRYIGGPAVSGFESEFARLHGAKHCIGTNSGTSALHVALWALGIGPGDEVIVPVNTFIATAEAVSLTGATPVFVDHDETYNLAIEPLRKLLSKKPGSVKGIIPVHLYGKPCSTDTIVNLARENDLVVVEDCCQAHLAHALNPLSNGSAKTPVGTAGSAGAFSFYPGKNLGAYGEAGAVITHDDALAAQIRKITDHGSDTKYHHEFPGHNYRLDAMQATILGVKLKYLKAWTDQRRNHARVYNEALKNIVEVDLPPKTVDDYHVYHLYIIRVRNRDPLRKFLEEQGIATGLHYPTPLHLQPAYSKLGYQRGDFPNAEKSCNEILSLPMFPELQPEQIQHVTESIKKFYSKRK
ncbi:MAG: DegT/DnrJ/EryC1/StrS family aminotransferase [Nitrospinota bacterium]|nr:DegT/DnrJ/EryC1/StrS family aminotransferase [Nitrospinota bacterium]